MKKFIAFILILSTLFSFVGCSSEKKPEPQISQMRAICELATMECYYHNVAKYHQNNIPTFLWFTGEKNFWIEYAGTVTIGIDAALVTIEIKENDVYVTIPPARVQGSSVDSTTLTKGSFIVADSSVEVKAEDQTKAFASAQYEMELAAAQDKTLLTNAQDRAKSLLKKYIDNIGNVLGVEYQVHWVEVDETGNPTGIVEQAPTETEEENSTTE